MHARTSRFDPRLIDGLVVAVVALPGVGELTVLLLTQPEEVRLTSGVLLVLQSAALWWRRRHPLRVLLVVFAALVVAQALGGADPSAYFAAPAAAYAVGAYGRRQDALVGLVALAVAAYLETVTPSLLPASDALAQDVLASPVGVLLVVAWGIGQYVRVRRAYQDTLVEYAHHLETEQEERTRRAVLEERRRIARELHDQVAHDLGVAALHTTAARTWLERDGVRAASALTSAEDAVRSALGRMPAILHALRTDDAPAELAPQPSIEDVESLVAGVRDAGVPVELRVEGDRRPLGAPVELAAYRIVQEALTNTLKHAGPAEAVVSLRYGRDRLDIEITDDGSGTTPNPSGAGLGIVGMHERVAELGGTLTAGDADGRGFAIRASLPLAAREATA